MELLSLVNQIVAQGNTSDVRTCPQKKGNCVEKFHCGEDCQPAQGAHKAFRAAIPKATTSYNGAHGTLTAGLKGSFETMDGEVLYDIK